MPPSRATATVALRLSLLFLASAPATADDAPSFTNEVMAVLSKAACNTGGCHGNPNGKGGLHLSLWGEDPAADLKAITSRKLIDPANPAHSDLLRKPTLAIPHEGGERFQPATEAYQILHDWIAAGAPSDLDQAPRLSSLTVSPDNAVLALPENTVTFSVTATFSDGQTQDVTRWAVFEPTTNAVEIDPTTATASAIDPNETVVMVRYLDLVTPARLAFVPPHAGWGGPPQPAPSYIDQQIDRKLQHLGIPPSTAADDATFLRRVSLDLTGLPPSADQARAFLDDPSQSKRERLVDSLLASPEHADLWALWWADLLRVEEIALDSTGVKTFHAWIRQAVADNMPLDDFARALLDSRGSTYDHPPANFWRALRTPPLRAESVAQVFLGVRLQCAQCHNHPFDRWTQDDYYRFAGLLAGIDYEIIENKREDKNDLNRFVGEQLVTVAWNAEWQDPRTKKAPAPGFLDPAAPAVDTAADPLAQLASWIADDNPLFARTQANRIWFRLMGRGLVDPVDDVRDSNPASHPDLLQALAADLVASGYDQRHLIRQIVLSAAYQRSSTPSPENAWDEINYSHATIRRLAAEQIVDSLHAFLGIPQTFEGQDTSLRAAQLPGIRGSYRRSNPTPCDRLLQLFGKPERLASSDLERSDETSLAQVFELTSGAALQSWLTSPDNHLSTWLEASDNPATLLDTAFLHGLSRRPTQPEADALLPLLTPPESRRTALEDIAWAIINSKEFLLRH
jgi:hypothetical protein